MSRSYLYLIDLTNTANSVDALEQTRDVVDESTLDPQPFGYSGMFVFIEQFLVIYDELIMNFILALVAVAILSLLVLGKVFIVILICLTVVSDGVCCSAVAIFSCDWIIECIDFLRLPCDLVVIEGLAPALSDLLQKSTRFFVGRVFRHAHRRKRCPRYMQLPCWFIGLRHWPYFLPRTVYPSWWSQGASSKGA